MNHSTDHNGFVFMGTVGGTLSGLCHAIAGHDLAQTAVLSAVGALVSFTVSFVLNSIVRRKQGGSGKA